MILQNADIKLTECCKRKSSTSKHAELADTQFCQIKHPQNWAVFQ